MKYQTLDEQFTLKLFDDDRGELPKISKDMEGPKILQDEVENAIKELKKTKLMGPMVY